MRKMWLALPALMLIVPCAAAQTQLPQLPKADPNEAKLNEVLNAWEKAMTGVSTLAAKCNRTDVSRTFQTTEQFEGIAKYMKGQGKELSKASLELHNLKKKGVFEKYLCTGDRLYEWDGGGKVIRVHNLPQPKAGQIADDNFLSFVFGMKAADARNRFNLSWIADPQHNNKYYYYFMIEPKTAADKADFTKARLTLTVDKMMPRQLWFHKPNGDEVTWDFPTVITPANIAAADFAQPQLPAGWQWQQIPRDAQPRVTRNNN
jgi:TIGR03009 family protein